MAILIVLARLQIGSAEVQEPVEFSAETFRRRLASGLTPGVERNGTSTEHRSVTPEDLDKLLTIQDDREFLQHAYRQILDRPCDVYGMVTHLEALANHVPRRTVIQTITNSDEAKGRRSVAREPDPPRRPLFARLYGRIMRVFGNLLRRIILVRFDSIDHKLMFLIQEIATRNESLSQKSDEALWTLSEKLDSNFAEGRLNQESLRAQVLDHDDRFAEVVATMRQFESAFHLQQRYVEDRFNGLQAHVDELTSKIDEADRKHAAASDRAFANLRAELEDLSARIAEAGKKTYPPVFPGNGDLLVTQVEGFIVGLPKEEWRVASHFAFRGALEPGLTKLFKEVVKPGMVVVDVGANVGIYTLLGARLLAGRGKVYSFEPTPGTASILRQNIQVNGFLESGIIDLRAEAVTDKRGVGRLTVFANDCGHNTLFGSSGEADSVNVPTISLDDALQAEDHVDFVKIDAEGSEADIIRGMRETIRRNPSIRIVLEFAPTHLRRANVDPAGFLSELRALGFTVTRVHDLSGELETVPDEELLHAFSANIHLSRPGASEGAFS